MSRPEVVTGPQDVRHAERVGAPLKVVAERLPADTLAPDVRDLGDLASEPVVPRARPAADPVVVRASPGPGPGVPAPPLADLSPEIASGATPGALPVLAPRPPRSRWRTLLRLWLPTRRGGRHRTDAPHIDAAWSMFAPLRDERRRRGLR